MPKSRAGPTISQKANLLSKTQLQETRLFVPKTLRRAAGNKRRIKAATTPTVALPPTPIVALSLTYQQSVNGEDLNPSKNMLQRNRKNAMLS